MDSRSLELFTNGDPNTDIRFELSENQKPIHITHIFNTFFLLFLYTTDYYSLKCKQNLTKSEIMPRCFMAKKLKSNLYQQWKQEQENQRSASGSRSPSPITMMNITHEDHLERSKELASTVASSGVAHTGHDLSHNGGKWCYFVHLVFNSQNGCKPRVIRI